MDVGLLEFLNLQVVRLMVKQQQRHWKTQRVIEEWIDTAKSLGREIPEPKGRVWYGKKK